MNSDIKKRIDAINNTEAIQFFFSLLKTFLQTASITETDERLAITIRNDYRKRFSVNLNSRLILFIKDGQEFGLMINNTDLNTITQIPVLKKEVFEKQTPEATLVSFDFEVLQQNIEILKPLWLKSCLEYLPSQIKSQYRKHHVDELFNIATDEALLGQYLTESSVKYTKFQQIIEDFKTYLKSEDSKLAGFSFQPIHQNYVWISDAQKIIGTNNFCHYEIISRKINPDKLWVEIHFEPKYKKHFKALFKNVESLNCFWNGDHKNPELSLAYQEAFDYEDIDLIAKMEKALLHLETNFGDAIRNEFQSMDIESIIKPDKKMDSPLNQILFGPPGTGKTYTTIEKAIAIANPSFNFKQERKEIKAEYNRLIEEGQIVFTTFHQSMSYEDFIEGIKPETLQNDVVYNIKNGIFKNICKAALTPNQLDFNTAYDHLKKELSEIEQIKLKTPRGKEFSISLNSNDNLTLHTGANKEKQGTLTKENIQKQINGESKFVGWEGYFKGVIDYLEAKYNYTYQSKNKTQNFVLIIDEINRGNVSAIFGELITLIEDDKRLGKDEALEVILPYSKEMFGVPPNLYIIGTMNTADRSVEALDTALRRRFCFEEIEPDSTLIATKGKLIDNQGIVDTINLPRVLETINNRIEILSNRDHKIGHSYFMKVESVEGLRDTFKKNIIPLLQEYFYNDYEKIGWVLGEGFFEEKKADKKTIFTKFFKQPKPEFELGYQLADIDKIDMKKAMLQLLGDFKEETQAENSEN